MTRQLWFSKIAATLKTVKYEYTQGMLRVSEHPILTPPPSFSFFTADGPCATLARRFGFQPSTAFLPTRAETLHG